MSRLLLLFEGLLKIVLSPGNYAPLNRTFILVLDFGCLLWFWEREIRILEFTSWRRLENLAFLLWRRVTLLLPWLLLFLRWKIWLVNFSFLLFRGRVKSLSFYSLCSLRWRLFYRSWLKTSLSNLIFIHSLLFIIVFLFPTLNCVMSLAYFFTLLAQLMLQLVFKLV